jgi:UDP-N-acetylglucosamine--N-acetylmuramyl-(pentapeptide) pyrophosphoryl-undecaprenol N-acetylglucosamine transferase
VLEELSNNAEQRAENREPGGPRPSVPGFVLWVGSAEGVEAEVIARQGLPFRGIAVGGVRGLAPWTMARNLGRLALGFAQAWRMLGDFRPDAILATGGYVCVPVALAGWLHRVPSLLYLPDIEPGLAVRFLARFATRVAVSFEASRAYLPADKVVVTGYPVRRALFQVEKTTACHMLGLQEGEKTLLVFGGSQGAHRINSAVYEVAARLAELCQVIHICGHADKGWLQERRGRLPRHLRRRYRVYPYLHEEMAYALAAADLAVARAGAATLGEFPALGLPSILVPYPYAGAHQERNARILAQAGAAVVIADMELRGQVLLSHVRELLGDAEALARMGEGARSLAQPEAAARIAEELRRLGGREA